MASSSRSEVEPPDEQEDKLGASGLDRRRFAKAGVGRSRCRVECYASTIRGFVSRVTVSTNRWARVTPAVLLRSLLFILRFCTCPHCICRLG